MYKKYDCFISSINNDFLLFNPYSLALAIIENPKGYSEVDFLSVLSDKQIKALFENNLFIENKSDAICLSRYYSNKSKYKRSLTISDAMTFACNMDCVYCFENQTKNNNFSITTDDRLKLISNLIDIYKKEVSSLDYVFFGGEPLLNLNYVEKVCEYITKQYSGLVVDYSFTSNGTLIDDRFIDLCNRFMFREIRITIDGTPRIHNSRRVMKNGNDSYELIMENINKLCLNTNIRIVINTVLDDDNTVCYLNMFNDLVKRFGNYILGDKPKIVFNIGILCHPMIDTNHTLDKGTNNTVGNINYYKLSEELIKRGATITSPFYTPHCMNSSEKTFTISPSGDIYKCVTGIGSKRFCLSTYDEFNQNPTILIKNNIYQIERSHRTECLSCEFLTMCNGGCKCQHHENNDILCRKNLLNREMDYFLHLLYYGCFTEDGLFKKRPGDLQ